MARFARSVAIVFLLVAAAAAQRPPQVDPSTLGATCATDGSSANIAFSTSGTDRVIVTNMCPNHAVRTINPNDARENSAFGVTDQTYRVPLAPTLAATAQRINLTCVPSVVGFARSGAVIFSVFPGTCGSDAVKLEGDTFDECGGHAQMTGMYHYHMTPSCLNSAHAVTGQHSPLLGYMLDGIPVYGPLGASGQVPTDLDGCGGHSSDGGNGGNYHYHMKPVTGSWPDPATPITNTAAIGAGFPYTPGCLAGCVPDAILSSLRNTGGSIEQTSYATCVAGGTAQPASESVSTSSSGATAVATSAPATTTTTTTTAAPAPDTAQTTAAPNGSGATPTPTASVAAFTAAPTAALPAGPSSNGVSAASAAAVLAPAVAAIVALLSAF